MLSLQQMVGMFLADVSVLHGHVFTGMIPCVMMATITLKALLTSSSIQFRWSHPVSCHMFVSVVQPTVL